MVSMVHYCTVVDQNQLLFVGYELPKLPLRQAAR
jgi:hypothetical protein